MSRYVLLDLDDARRIARWLEGAPLDREPVIDPLCEAWRSGEPGEGGPFYCALAAGHAGGHELTERVTHHMCASAARLADRFADETGADIEDVVGQLKALEVCAACSIEGRASDCAVHAAHKLGRRLRRMVERAAVRS